MPLKKITLKTTQLHQNQRLDQVLAEWLPQALSQPVSKGKVRKLIVAGAVYLNGSRVRIASKNLMPNARIEVYIDLEKLNSTGKEQDIHFVMTEDRILFEDEDLIAVNKPPGLPTQPTLDEARDNLYQSIKSFMAKRQKCAITDVYLGLHHRLDRDTSGVILFTKTQRVNRGISDIFTQHLAKKIYQAISVVDTKLQKKSLDQPFSEAWEVKNYLGKVSTSGKRAQFGAIRGGDFAHTEFKLLKKLGAVRWIEARPHTGRTHQIRVHLSELGLPILGDRLYGGPAQMGGLPISRVMLHAASLTFPHPIHQNSIAIESPLPEDFNQCLQALQRSHS
jgi:23S rRNA pseudouridine1911/1915/1917 synthase